MDFDTQATKTHTKYKQSNSKYVHIGLPWCLHGPCNDDNTFACTPTQVIKQHTYKIQIPNNPDDANAT